jgi:hypothetical protein
MPIIPVSDDVIVHRLRKGPGEFEDLVFQLPDNTENRYVATPSTVFKIADITKSNLKSLPDYVTCFKYFYSTMQPVHSVASGGFKGSGRNQLTDLTVLIATDSYRGDLLTKLSQGAPIPEISILSLLWVGEDKPKIKAEDKFKDCHIIGHTESRYATLFTFRCEQLMVKINLMDQASGDLKGQNEVKFDFVKNKPDSDLEATD